MKRLLLLLTLLSAGFSMAQTQFWADNFDSSPTSGTRTPEENGGTTPLPSTSYFRLTDGSTVSQVVPFTGKEGTSYWAGEDHNALGTGFTASGAVSNQTASAATNELQIDWTGINIAGKSTLSFKGLIAAASTNEPWDNTNACISGVGTTNTDYIIIEYSIDGGAYTPLIRFFNRGSAANGVDKYLFEDTDGNGCGDGTQLTNVFGEFVKSIPGTGTTLSLRIRVFSEGSNEEWGIDNFRLFEVAACTAPTITANPPNRAICVNGNTTFSSTATGATAYQWQVNTGSGFTDITNGGVYSNATTSTLTITGATSGMNGYLYRCTAINGVASCFTNSNSGTLSISNITSPTAQNNITCFGLSNGSAAVSPTGGIGSYTYSWAPSGGTSSIATGLSAGSYTVTITDAISCQITKNFTLTQPTALNTSAGSQTNVACNAGSNGSATVSPSGGTPGYTYSWSPSGGTGATASSLTVGSYTVTVTDANNCSATKSFTITQPPAIAGSTIVTNVACNGGTNGAINLTPSGGASGYTFSWGGGITTEDRTGLAAGTYSVTITDANACTKTVSGITVTQPTAVSGSTVVTNVACFGGNTGAINLTPTGGTGPYTFNWASGPTTEDRTSLTAGTYSVTITDANGCTGTVSPTVTQPAASVSGTTVVTNVACFGGNTGAINLTPTGGVGPYTFNWASGPTTEDRTSLTAGTYSVTITDANGCTGTVSPTVTQPAASVSGTTVVTNVACFGGNTGAINLTPTGGVGPYTFNWASGPTTEDRTGLAAGTYSVIITDANGCTGGASATVTQPTAISASTVVTNVACNGGTNGAINLTPSGGTGPYTFNWASGPTTEDRTGLVAGSYSVTITDVNGCTGTASATVTQPTALNATSSQTNVSCNGGSNGTATVNVTGGTPSYTYSWSPSGGTFASTTGRPAGTYTVTITDANACQTTRSFTITEPTALAATAAAQTNVSCNGGSNGAATVSVTGGTPGYTYSWSPSGGTAATATGLAAGTYTVTVTDANSCQTTQSFTITESAAIAFTAASQTNVACFGGNTGAFAVNPALGGAGAFTYDWAPGTPTGDGTTAVTGLTAGTYSVTATDANSCTATITFTITQPTALSVTASSQTNVSCNGGSNGAVAINAATGGTPGYTYDWAPGTPVGDGTTSITGIGAGTYTVTVTDANGCTASQSFTVTQPTALSVTAASQTNIACNGGSTGAAAINTPTGGTPGYTYDWTPGSPTGDGTISVTGLTAGTWTCDITDANGCMASQSFTITEPAALSVTAASQTNIACNGGLTGAAAINAANGGTPGYTYDWTPGTPAGDGTTSISGIGAGTYTVTVTDANGCTGSQSFTITEPAALSVTAASQTNIACNGGVNGAASINLPTGGTPGYTYDWAPGTPTGDGTTSITGLAAGSYSVITTDANGCMATVSFTITEPQAIVITPTSQTNVSCNGGANGSASIFINGGTPGFTYSWSPSGGTNANASGLSAGTYTVTVTDANGCEATQSFVITEPTALDLSDNSQVNILCNGASTGSATVTPTGGTGTYTYSWAPAGGTAQTASGLTAGTYTVTVTDANFCQATQTFVITESAPLTSSFSHTACNTYTWGTQTYTTSGIYTQILAAANGCDSTVTLTLTISTEITNTVTESNCVSYTWAQNGMTYTTSGLYVDTIPSAGGCDSIVTLDLTINTPSSSSSSEFSCGSYMWAQTGMTYTMSGVYMDTIPNAAGCDSVITLNLTIGGSSATENVTVCETYTWNQTGITYTASGMYSDTLVDVNGCDSILILNLTITGAPSASITNNGSTLTASSGTTYQWLNCNGTVAISGATGQTFVPTANGSYSVVVTNAAGCSDTAACVVVTGLGLEELDSQSVQVFPNPTENQVTITMTFATANLVITDVQGKIHYTGQISNGQLINLAQYADGVYFLSIETETGKILKRIVKN
nr:T9SS type A sorting domain-containing protein [uncultured Fluviicola sp.]